MVTDNGVSSTAEMLLAGRDTVIENFQCPSQPDGDRAHGGQGGYQPNSYNGNIGTNVYNDCNGSNPGCIRADGIFYINSAIRFRDITDGLSSTLPYWKCRRSLRLTCRAETESTISRRVATAIHRLIFRST